ncbi:protein ATP6V1FNB [Polypterus senegalus]|uniref:protein ATP6V1FNB n=1 Tax=Polypterus senegalus TaxID=55291 RepID=UPI0019643EA6|nr:protein ATP6V1FNB [Polypterus senegalus]
MKPPEKSRVEATPPQMTQAVLDSPITLMRSVTPVTKDLIYQGISREGKGRQLYLQRRTVKNPEDKYELPLLSSWDYGWRLGDFVREVKTPINGRSAIVKSTFYARNGIFNFPAPTDKLG